MSEGVTELTSGVENNFIKKDPAVHKGIETKPEASTKLHEPRYFSSEYHGNKISVVEFDHRPATLNGEFYDLPNDWKKQLYGILEQDPDATLAPEYCMPDLEQTAFREMGTGGWARSESEGSQHITEFYGVISRFAGAKGKNLIAMDPANTNLFLFGEGIENISLGIPEQIKSSLEKRSPNYEAIGSGGRYGQIDEKELMSKRLVDSRRLITARGLMQEVLKNKQNILHINAPVHAERIDNYIKRQNEYEANSGIYVEQPQDLAYVSPKEEREKMTIYGKLPFHRTIREYTPLLSQDFYQLETDIKDVPDMTERVVDGLTETEDLQKAQNTLKIFLLLHNAKNNTEKVQIDRLKKAEELIGKILLNQDRDNSKDWTNLNRLLSTDWAWKRIRKEYIY